ncbi:MAG: CRISPR-associated endonuclease Cas1 [Bacteroidetes bacterium]|nr:CRISPR-associated endonuclease Cas1 [Bacteroidota bacterium]
MNSIIDPKIGFTQPASQVSGSFSSPFTPDLIHQSWQKVLSKGKSGGIDGISLSEFQNELKVNLKELGAELNAGTYCPDPSLQTQIPKDKPGEWRKLGMLSVRDKIAQHAVKTLIEPILEKKFYPQSFAYRPEKGHHKSIEMITGQIKRGFTFALGLDVDNFFDSISHDILLDQLQKLTLDSRITRYLELWLKIGTSRRGKITDETKGVTQGGVISPLLSNFYLTPFDHWISSTFPDIRYIRYADNLFLMSKKAETLLENVPKIEARLLESLKLSLNTHSSEPVKFTGQVNAFEFCGICFHGEGDKICRTISPSKIEKAKRSIRDITRLTGRPLDQDFMGEDLNHQFEAWRRYYEPFETSEQLFELEMETIRLLQFHRVRFGKTFTTWIKSLRWCTPKSDSWWQQELSQEKPLQVKTAEVVQSKIETGKQSVRAQIHIKRRKYDKLYRKRFDLVLDRPGLYLGRSNQNIVIREGSREIQKSAVTSLKHIGISAQKCSISSDALFLIAEHGIQVELVDFTGKAIAQFSSREDSSWGLGLAQMQSVTDHTGVSIAKSIILAKIHNQAALIQYWTKFHGKRIPEWDVLVKAELERIRQYKESIKKLDHQIGKDDYRNQLMGYEGLAAAGYWTVAKKYLEPVIQFPGRQRKGAKDLVNMSLNYGYGILYSRVWAMIIYHQLNPHIAYIHSEQKHKPVLVYDLIEPFRQPIVDRTVLALIRQKVLTGDPVNFQLTDHQRRCVLDAIINRLNTPFKHNKKNTSFADLIDESCKNLAGYINGTLTEFNPFLMKW